MNDAGLVFQQRGKERMDGEVGGYRGRGGERGEFRTEIKKVK